MNKMAGRILRVGAALGLFVAAISPAFGWLFPHSLKAMPCLLMGIYVAAFIFLVSFIAYIFLLYFSYRDTEKRSTELRLRERMKELSCIYEVFDACRKAHTVDEMLEQLPDKVRSAMLNPESCFVMVEHDGKTSGEYPPRKEIKNEFVAPIVLSGSRKSQLCAAYVTEDQIMPEEKQFLGLVAGIFAQAVERIQAASKRADGR